MRTKAEIYGIRDEMFAQIASDIDNYICNNKTKVQQFIELNDVQKSMDYLLDFLSIITTIVKAPNINGVCLPLFITKLETTDIGYLKSFNLIVRSKVKAEVQYKTITNIRVSENVVEDMAAVILDGVFAMYFHEMALQNLEYLNTKISMICKEKNIKQMFKFTISNDNKVINYIDNDIVIFNASVEKALDITRQGILLSGDDYTNLICKDTTERLVELLQTCETTPQLIKGNIPLIKEVTDLSTKKRASKLIRETYHRNAEVLKSIKAGVGYFEDIIEYDDEEIKIFSLIEKKEDGSYKVVLNPFDTVTLFNIDYDVLDALGVK